MTSEEFALITLNETTNDYVKLVDVSDTESLVTEKRNLKNNRRYEDRSLFFRIPKLSLKPNFKTFRHCLQKMSCLKREDDEISIMDDQRRRSIDIGVGLARRMSLFLFTKKSVCIHPYHPYTPKQTTRKIYLNHDEM
ncbi:unnamed protein product [Euphydryas editha]|uniref:Uncharacterized protein n=1 Tax=Euphydryas editha TaxID=104508 RepID=A0AAU9TJF3_EUPED|nr:unnamed protein product [Euphydryas editha]